MLICCIADWQSAERSIRRYARYQTSDTVPARAGPVCATSWHSADRFLVAQIVNLLYRRLAVGRALNSPLRHAGYQPAIQQTTSLRYDLRPLRVAVQKFSDEYHSPPIAVTPDEPNRGLERVEFQLRAAGVNNERTSPLRAGIHSRGYLPHVKRENSSYFVTFRLADSLPKDVLLEFERERAEALRRLPTHASQVETEEIGREFRRKVERCLDRGVGECHLRRPEIADMMAEALRHFDGKQYLLDDWVVMPNHVHVVLWPMPNFTLSEILRSRKRHTARQANLILGRTGENFWQRESYDHWIRDEDEKARIRRYIRVNPVRAQLCRSPEDWKWSSAWSGWQSDRSADC